MFGFWLMGDDGDVAVGMLAVHNIGAWGGGDAESLRADRNTSVGSDLDWGAQAPDKRPPRAAGRGAQNIVVFLAGPAGGVIGGASKFAVDFPGVAVAAEHGQEKVGGLRGGDGLGGEEGGKAALPVLVLTLNFPLGLRSARVAQGDAVKVKGSAELSQRVRPLGKEHAVEST